jgi:hypothetical protein
MDKGQLFKTGFRMTPQSEKLSCSLSLSLFSLLSTNLVDNSSIRDYYDHPRD